MRTGSSPVSSCAVAVCSHAPTDGCCETSRLFVTVARPSLELHTQTNDRHWSTVHASSWESGTAAWFTGSGPCSRAVYGSGVTSTDPNAHGLESLRVRNRKQYALPAPHLPAFSTMFVPASP